MHMDNITITLLPVADMVVEDYLWLTGALADCTG